VVVVAKDAAANTARRLTFFGCVLNCVVGICFGIGFLF
jgi:hypothetical protein